MWCAACDQPMEQLKKGAGRWAWYCRSCDPSPEERAAATRALPPTGLKIWPGELHRLTDGRRGTVLATIPARGSVWIEVDGVQQEMARDLIEGRAA
jgi:hypothetical protein